jgi:protein TonB
MAEEERPAKFRNLLVAGVVILALALVGAGVYYFMNLKSSGGPKKPPKISLIPTTPPPPPPPPKEEKRPEPPKEQKEVKMEQVEQKNEAPPDQSLKMEGAAGEGPSVFGGGKVVNEDMGKIGEPGAATGGPATSGTNRMQFAMFTNNAQQLLHDEIKKRLADKTRGRDFRASYKIWLDPDGSIKRFELTPTGNSDVDEDLRAALAEVRSLRLAPPADMPQPLRFLFTSRAAG